MFVGGNVLEGVARVLDIVLTLYMWVIIARALVSWVNPDPWNPIVQFLNRATEPVLLPIRRRLGWQMGIDWSPMIAILVIVFLQYALIQSLYGLAVRLQHE
jgi:YggT family protein